MTLTLIAWWGEGEGEDFLGGSYDFRGGQRSSFKRDFDKCMLSYKNQKKKNIYKSNNQTSKHHTLTHTHIQTKHQTIHLHNFITQLSTKYTSKNANLT